MSTNTAEVRPTSATDRFRELNEIIKAGMRIFLAVGEALLEVKTRLLYLEEYSSWDSYLEEQFGIKRQYASRLIKAKAIVSQLESMLPIGNMTMLPQNESQVRPLYRLKSAQDRSMAWSEAVAAANGNIPTAEIVSEKVKELLPERGARQPFNAGLRGIVLTGNRESTKAVLCDGSEIPNSLWSQGYIDAETAQRKIDQIGQLPGIDPQEKLLIQRFFIDLTATLTTLTDEHPTRELRNGIMTFIRDILCNIPLLAAKPGDMEPSGRPTE